MSDQYAIFTLPDGRRIRNVVRSVEGDPTSTAGIQVNLPAPARRARVQVKITGTEDGGGKYSGSLIGGTTDDVDTSSDLSADDLGPTITLPGSRQVLIVNRPEAGGSGHLLSTGSVWGGNIIRRQTDGTIVVAIDGIPQSAFPVKVTNDGGSDGDASTAASYTYAVTNLAGDTTLASALALSRPRPNGSMIAGASYGLAFYDSGVLVLWDAGEVENTDQECDSEGGGGE